MTYEELVSGEPSGTGVTVEHDGEQTRAMLFRREALDPEFAEDELEIWLETAEDEEDDDDLVLCGIHPTDEDSQVERLLWYRPSEGANGKVYACDVDGTVVPGTLTVFADSFDVFKPAR